MPGGQFAHRPDFANARFFTSAKNFHKCVDRNKPSPYMDPVAQMAELVDALVSGISA